MYSTPNDWTATLGRSLPRFHASPHRLAAGAHSHPAPASRTVMRAQRARAAAAPPATAAAVAPRRPVAIRQAAWSTQMVVVSSLPALPSPPLLPPPPSSSRMSSPPPGALCRPPLRASGLASQRRERLVGRTAARAGRPLLPLPPLPPPPPLQPASSLPPPLPRPPGGWRPRDGDGDGAVVATVIIPRSGTTSFFLPCTCPLACRSTRAPPRPIAHHCRPSCADVPRP